MSSRSFLFPAAFISNQIKQLCAYTTKTRLYNFDPIKPHFYIVKLGFTGVYIIFLIFFAKKHRLWVHKRTRHRGGFNVKSTHNLCFEQEYAKYQNFLSENFPFLVVKFSIYLNRCVFVMERRASKSLCDLSRMNGGQQFLF